MLQGRVTNQAAQLDARAALESAVLKATAILEQRLTDQQVLELNQTPREPLADKTKVHLHQRLFAHVECGSQVLDHAFWVRR